MTGMRLRKIREFFGLSQARLARELGVSSNTVFKWEHDERPISRTVELAVERVVQKYLITGPLWGESEQE